MVPTEAGERLIQRLGPHLEEIEQALAALRDTRERPAGNLRITAGEHAASAVLWPALKPFMLQYPDINIEITVDNGLTDIVGDRFDAGVRLGEQVAKDMIAVRIAPDMRMAVVGSPAYLQRAGTPQTPWDLAQHRCINLRLPTRGGLYAWEFARDGREIQVRVEGQLILNSLPQRIDAAEAGLGLAYVPDDCVAEALASGRLVRVLAEWTPPSPATISITPAGASIPALSRCYWKLCDADLIDKSVKCSRKCFRCVTIRLRVGFSAMSELISYVRMMRKPA